MKRLVEQDLLKWKQSPRRKPLLVRGARQVGKTYSIRQFGREHFSGLVSVDLERNRDYHRIFDGDLSAGRVIAELEVVTNAKITPGRTLLFLDEIQSCPRAITALRYFYEECPELHVVAAGSLLEFAAKDTSFPVGRLQHLEMHPLCFLEYLWAAGMDRAADVVASPPRRIPDAVHLLLLGELRKYLFIGGMPEAVKAHIETGSLKESFDVHRELCDSFREDFPKYAPRADPYCLDAVFAGAARHAGRQVKYAHLAHGYANATVKKAFELLCMARVVRKVPATSPAGLPLGAGASAKRFKALMLDVGLWQHLCGMATESEYHAEDLMAIHRGAMAEQFVGQEMLVAQDSELYYWARQARGSLAEVDYLAVARGQIYGVEVKSSAAGRLRSLHMMLEAHPNCAGGLVFSTRPQEELPEQKLTFLPLYCAFSATRRE